LIIAEKLIPAPAAAAAGYVYASADDSAFPAPGTVRSLVRGEAAMTAFEDHNGQE